MCPKFPSKLIKYLREYIIFFKTYNITYGRYAFHSEKCERLHTVCNKIANARVFIINSDVLK